MNVKNSFLAIMVSLLAGCYTPPADYEDLDGIAREIAANIRYSEFLVHEESVTSREQDAVRVTAKFYYYREPRTIIYHKYFIPGKYTTPSASQYSGYITGEKTLTEARLRAEENLLVNVFQKLFPDIIAGDSLSEVVPGGSSEQEKLKRLIVLLQREDPGLFRDIWSAEVSRYSKYVTPEIDPQTLDYLVRRGALERQMTESYYNYAVLVELNESRRGELINRVKAGLSRMVYAARRERVAEVFRDVWNHYRSSLAIKLGPNAEGLSYVQSPEDLTARLKLEVAGLNPAEPALRIKASIVTDGGDKPASQAMVLMNGISPLRADSTGQILLSREFLLSHCLAGGTISAHFQFEILRDITRDLNQRTLPDGPWKEALAASDLEVSFRYEGRAKIIGFPPVYEITEAGRIFKKAKSVVVQGFLQEENFVPVTLKKAIIRWSFFNESKRRPVDFHEEAISMNLALKKRATYSLEIPDPELLAKIKKYKLAKVAIRFEGTDGAGNPVVAETRTKD